MTHMKTNQYSFSFKESFVVGHRLFQAKMGTTEFECRAQSPFCQPRSLICTEAALASVCLLIAKVAGWHRKKVSQADNKLCKLKITWQGLLRNSQTVKPGQRVMVLCPGKQETLLKEHGVPFSIYSVFQGEVQIECITLTFKWQMDGSW